MANTNIIAGIVATIREYLKQSIIVEATTRDCLHHIVDLIILNFAMVTDKGHLASEDRKVQI